MPGCSVEIMSGTMARGENSAMKTRKLSLSQKYARFRVRLRDHEWRQYGALLLAGKLIGVALLLLGILAFNHTRIGTSAHAQAPPTAPRQAPPVSAPPGKPTAAPAPAAIPELKGNGILNPVNTAW